MDLRENSGKKEGKIINVTNTSNSYYPLVIGVALCIAGFRDNQIYNQFVGLIAG